MKNIGVFDSGVGGLTVAHAIFKQNVAENLIYFGDLAHLPYGDKSEAAIQSYSIRIAEFLVSKGCDTIVIACNSASASATELLKEHLARSIRVINVIEPMVDYTAANYSSKKVGIIGTKRTIDSGIYETLLKAKDNSIEVRTLATPLLVPLIEENLFSAELRLQVVKEYLNIGEMEQMDALILGCTHYPMIKSEIASVLPEKVKILDSPGVMADFLEKNGAQVGKYNTQIQCFVSDKTSYFQEAANRFFQRPVELTVQKLVSMY